MKPYYSKGLMIFDVFAVLITGGFWLIIVIMRELYRANRNKK